MTQIVIAKNIIHKISVLSSRDENLKSESQLQKFIIVSGNNSLRWIVPCNPVLGKKVLAQWRPYGRSSLFKWRLFQLLYSLGISQMLPGVDKINSDELAKLGTFSNLHDLAPVIYIGTPNSQQKAVITFVDGLGDAISVMKIALEDGASKSLQIEANILKFLENNNVNNVPRLKSIGKDNRCSLQSVVPGVLSSRTQSKLHIDWLLNLPKSGRTSSFEKQKKLVNQIINNEEVNLSENELELFRSALNYIVSENEFDLVMVHGDFAPWNIKLPKAGAIAVIDWEDARCDWLPLWDLCHFHFIQAHLFKDSNAIEELNNSSFVDDYFCKLGLIKSDLSSFVLLYCMYMVIPNSTSVDRTYREFLIDVVKTVLSQ